MTAKSSKLSIFFWGSDAIDFAGGLLLAYQDRMNL